MLKDIQDGPAAQVEYSLQLCCELLHPPPCLKRQSVLRIADKYIPDIADKYIPDIADKYMPHIADKYILGRSRSDASLCHQLLIGCIAQVSYYHLNTVSKSGQLSYD